MNKKKYIKPSAEVVILNYMNHLLADSQSLKTFNPNESDDITDSDEIL